MWYCHFVDEIFFNWANNYFIKQPHGESGLIISPADHGYFNFIFQRELAFENFKTTCLTKNQANEYKPTLFKTHLNAWCEYNGFELNPADKCSDKQNSRIPKTIEGKTLECFYISTLRSSRDMGEEQKTVIEEDDKPNLPF